MERDATDVETFDMSVDNARTALLRARQYCWDVVRLATKQEVEGPLYVWAKDAIQQLLTIDNQFLDALRQERGD